MAAKNLCTADDVADMWRPLIDDAERTKVDRIIGKASSLLRQKLPSVDIRMATFATDPSDVSALDPDTVASVVAVVVKRFLSNPDGTTHIQKSLGGASVSYGYALRGDKDPRGDLVITEDDLAKLNPPMQSNPWLGTVTTKHKLAPPCGDGINEEFDAQSIAPFDSGGYDSPPDTWLGVLP